MTDSLAFPLLLRGLDKTDNWTKLNRAELSALETTQPIISRPQVSTYTNDKKMWTEIIYFWFIGFAKWGIRWQNSNFRGSGSCSLFVSCRREGRADQRRFEDSSLQKFLKTKLIHPGNNILINICAKYVKNIRILYCFIYH